MNKTTNKIVLRVTDGDDNFDYSSDAAVVKITSGFKSYVQNLHKELMRLKSGLSGVYDLRAFDNTPKFLGSGELSEQLESVSYEIYKKEKKILTEEEYDLITNSENTVNTDVVLLQVKEEGFYWTGYYKHTQIRFITAIITMDELEAMNTPQNEI